jgi:predicted metal-binding membrane protein
MWLLLLAGAQTLPTFVHCPAPSPAQGRLVASLQMFLTMNPPAALALGWVVMLWAMMLPALTAPIRYLYRRSFHHRRARSIVLFLSGYGGVWMACGGVLVALEFGTRFFGDESYFSTMGIVLIAILWQVSPFKQRCLNRCHAFPQLSAFGAAADWDALVFGMTQGMWCAGSCWVLMLLPTLLPRGHLVAMAVVAVFIYCERLEHPRPPRWRWRGCGRAVRFAIAQGRIRWQALLPLPRSR